MKNRVGVSRVVEILKTVCEFADFIGGSLRNAVVLMQVLVKQEEADETKALSAIH